MEEREKKGTAPIQIRFSRDLSMCILFPAYILTYRLLDPMISASANLFGVARTLYTLHMHTILLSTTISVIRIEKRNEKRRWTTSVIKCVYVMPAKGRRLHSLLWIHVKLNKALATWKAFATRKWLGPVRCIEPSIPINFHDANEKEDLKKI